MARQTTSTRTVLDLAGRWLRRGVYALAIALGLLCGLLAGLLAWAAGADPATVLAGLLVGAGGGWVLARAMIASRRRLLWAVSTWAVARVLPGSRAALLLATARTGARGRVPRR